MSNYYKQICFFLLFATLSSYGQSSFTPSAVSCLRLWLSSDSGITVDGSNNVMQWNDISGNNNNFIQATPANRPAYVSNNLFRTYGLQFDGSAKELINSSFLNGTN
ncbi:MAG: hypothetical protein HY840_01365, partial [Bacteroidetes bacterium]|nr:hypothetical protein [Bacteroidota bacterium]